jgi:hypothetical protein
VKKAPLPSASVSLMIFFDECPISTLASATPDNVPYLDDGISSYAFMFASLKTISSAMKPS